MTIWHLYLCTFLTSSIVMSALWGVCFRIRNFGFVDIGWALLFALNFIFFAFLTNPSETTILLGAMYSVWSIRLSVHLFRRVFSLHPIEDKRYQTLRTSWSNNLRVKSFLFFQAQALLVAIFSGPLLLSILDHTSEIRIFQVIGFFIWLIALWGETISDQQLKRFVSEPKNKGKVCNVGLWKYSRHPNYFFEWLIWVGYFIFSLPTGWPMIYCPLLMLFFLFKVTGIPAAESESLKSKGDAYKDYQKTTSAFVPWFPLK